MATAEERAYYDRDDDPPEEYCPGCGDVYDGPDICPACVADVLSDLEYFETLEAS